MMLKVDTTQQGIGWNPTSAGVCVSIVRFEFAAGEVEMQQVDGVAL